MGKPNALSGREDHAEGIEDDNKGVVVITPDKIRMTILIMDEGDSLKQKFLTPPAYCQKLTFKGYVKRTPFVKNMMAHSWTIWADFTCPRVIYYGWKLFKNTTTPQ